MELTKRMQTKETTMNHTLALLTTLLLAPLASLRAETVMLRVEPDKVVGHIDERIYGHFLEHGYHSCNGGLWGEVVWNRSFEETCSRETGWRVCAGVLESPPPTRRESRFNFVHYWSDFECTLDAQQTGGDGELLVMFRDDVFNARDTLVLGKEIRLEHFQRNRKTQKEETVTLATAAGPVERRRWCQVRIRCEKKHLQVWLDDKPLFDLTDKVAHRLGGIGVGVRNASGRFRQLRAATLSGTALLAEPLSSPARHWRAFGTGTVTLSTQQPLNSKFCLNLVDDAGVRQSGFALRAGDPLRGSLWARGNGTLTVKLGDDEKTFTALSADWKEYPLEFAPKSGDTLQITGHGNVFIDQVSLMPDSARATGGLRPDLLGAVAALRPPVIRWPGGCFVNRYDWKNGIGPQHKRVGKNGADELDPLSFGIDEFIAFCRKVGAEPLLCINVAPNQPELVRDACDFIEYCNGDARTKWGAARAANGHREPYNVKQWEIGNETWAMGSTNYVEIVRQFVPPMKNMDPTIQISICGSASFDLKWNAEIIAGCAELADYLSLHHYEKPERFADGPANYAAFWRDTGKLIAASKNPKLKLFVSEWNAQSIDWRTGLYGGGILNEFERASDVVSLATPALWLRHVSAPAWDNAFINFDAGGWFPAPNYVVMKLWRDHFAPDRVALAGNPGPLNVLATKGRELIVKAVNPSTNTVPVELNVGAGFAVGRAALTVVSSSDLNARNTLTEPDKLRPVPGEAEVAGQTVRFKLPPLAAAALRIQPARN